MEPASNQASKGSTIQHGKEDEAAARTSGELSDPAASAEAPLTNAGRAIEAILKVDVSRTPADALASLMKLEYHPLPSSFFGGQPKPGDAGLLISSFCFDLHPIRRSWTSQQPCERCRSIHELQLCRFTEAQLRGPTTMTAEVIKALYKTACLHTRCDKDVRLHETPRLPPEIRDMIVQAAIARAKATGNGRALCKLMHTSSQIRYQVVSAFKPITFCELYTESDPDSKVLPIPWELHSYVWQAVSAHYLDVSTKRHEGKGPTIPESDAELATISGSFFHRVHCQVDIEVIGSDSVVTERATGFGLAEEDEAPEDQHLKVGEVCAMLCDALNDDALRLAPSCASLFVRFWLGSRPLEVPALSRLEITVELSFRNDTTMGVESFLDRTWKFVYIPPRPASGSA